MKTLTAAGFEMNNISIVGKGYHTDEKVVGFLQYRRSSQILGHPRGVLERVLGPFPRRISCGHRNRRDRECRRRRGVSALAAALYSRGIPKDSVIQYETELKTDNFLVMAHVPAADIARAKTILGTVNPARLEVHAGTPTTQPIAAEID